MRETVDAAQEVKLEPPRPLVRELPPADPFPIAVLPAILRSAAEAINERVQAPLAICGQSVLAAATLAVQAHANIELPTGQARPISEFFATVAESGERKTACDTEALWPIRHREKSLRDQRETDLPRYLNTKAAWDRARDFAMKKGKGDCAAIRAALDTLGPAPTAPLDPLLTCPEPTYEGLCKLFVSGQPSVGIFATEGGQFIGGHGMTDDAKLRTAAGLSAAWDGEPIRRVRAGDGALFMPGRRLAMHLMMQPDVANRMLNDHLLMSQGMLSRLLVTAPDTAAGNRLWHDPSPASDAAIKRYGARLLDILEWAMPLAQGKPNELEPRRLSLSPSARRIWIEFADYIEKRIAPNGELEPVRGLANKLPEHAARLAAVLGLATDLETNEITDENLASGVELAQHYGVEALRIFGASRVDAELKLAQRAIGWLHGVWRERLVSLPDLYQSGPQAIRNKETAGRIVGILEDHGWLRRLTGPEVVRGVKRRDVWAIVREF